jgi:hypothetical protein
MPLSNALRLNAIFTFACAIICLIFPLPVSAMIAMQNSVWIIGLGIMLAAYVPILLYAASRQLRWLVTTIIVLDWGFVLMALAYYAFRNEKIDLPGMAVIMVPAAVVALFALIQMSAISSLKKDAAR